MLEGTPGPRYRAGGAMREQVDFWTRLEPRAVDGDVRRGEAAEVCDPLWFLARQWQFGEFLGEDAGTPASVSVQYATANLAEWYTASPGALERSVPLDRGAPFEAQALGEPWDLNDLPSRVELGQWFINAFHRAGGNSGVLAQYLARYAFDRTHMREEGVAFLAACGAMVLDGVSLFSDIQARPATPAPDITLEASEFSAALGAQQALVDQVRAIFGTIGPADPPAWRTERLGYELGVRTVAAPGRLDFKVHIEPGAQIDWYSLDVGLTAPGAMEWHSQTQEYPPGQVRFKGMPNERFWDMEPGAMDPGGIEGDSRDLARLIFIDTLQVAGNDWFMVPLELPIGVVAQVKQLMVRDVFGIDTSVESTRRSSPTGESTWQMFTTAQEATGETLDALCLLPKAVGASSAPPIERIRFLRDELANMAWAVEVILPNQLGLPRQCLYDAPTSDATSEDTSPGDVSLQYRLQTVAPPHWIPLIPMVEPRSGWIGQSLHLGVVRFGDVLRRSSVSSRILSSPPDLVVQSSHIPRTGRVVERGYVRALDHLGGVRIWVERRVSSGMGEGQSGLTYDFVNYRL